MIVIDLIGIQSLEQALEVVQTMPVIFSDRGPENRWQFPRVFFAAKRIQQQFALAQNFSDGILQRRSVHRYAPRIGTRRRCKNSNTVLQAATASDKPNSSPPSFITTMPSTVRWLKIAPSMTASAS